MKPSETLTKVRELLQDEARWTKGAPARDADGNMTYLEEKATCWCIVGALYKVGRETQEQGAFNVNKERKYLWDAVNENAVPFNDDPRTTHSDVLRALDTAIALAKKDEQANEAK